MQEIQCKGESWSHNSGPDSKSVPQVAIITSFQSGPKSSAEVNVEETGINLLYRNRDLAEIKWGSGMESSLLFSKKVLCVLTGRGC